MLHDDDHVWSGQLLHQASMHVLVAYPAPLEKNVCNREILVKHYQVVRQKIISSTYEHYQLGIDHLFLTDQQQKREYY